MWHRFRLIVGYDIIIIVCTPVLVFGIVTHWYNIASWIRCAHIILADRDLAVKFDQPGIVKKESK